MITIPIRKSMTVSALMIFFAIKRSFITAQRGRATPHRQGHTGKYKGQLWAWGTEGVKRSPYTVPWMQALETIRPQSPGLPPLTWSLKSWNGNFLSPRQHEDSKQIVQKSKWRYVCSQAYIRQNWAGEGEEKSGNLVFLKTHQVWIF